MNKWDIVLLTYPFTNLSGAKVRPALVISQTSYNQISNDLVIISITSNISRRSEYDVFVARDHAEFQQTGLRFDSMIRVDKIFTLNKKLVAMNLGRLGIHLQRTIDKQLRLFLDLPDNQLVLNI